MPPAKQDQDTKRASSAVNSAIGKQTVEKGKKIGRATLEDEIKDKYDYRVPPYEFGSWLAILSQISQSNGSLNSYFLSFR